MVAPDDGFDTDELSTPTLYALLCKHFLFKGWQVGALAGCTVVLPVVAVRHYRAGGSGAELAPKALRALATSGGVGLAAVGVMGAHRVATAVRERDAVADRVYRLHYNAGQTRTDLFASVGLALGAGLAAAALGPTAAVVLGGASAGTAAGVAAHMLTSKELRGGLPRHE